MPGIIVRPRARILHGHDWVYSTEILKTYGAPKDGEVITLKDPRDRLLGSAIYNSRSKIPARRFSRGRQKLDDDLLRARLTRAFEARRRRGCDPVLSRLFWSESDGLPGLIIDRYGDILVIQTQTLAMDILREPIARIAMELTGARGVFERNEGSQRAQEGLEPRSGVLLGEVPNSVTLTTRGRTFEVDFLTGHKTGLYLDQLDSHTAVARHAAGRHVLDCFANTGGFAIACALAGAVETVAVESSESCCESIRRHGALNNVNCRVIQGDVFQYLSAAERRGEKHDLIILDPPSFTRGKSGLSGALRGYLDLHQRAARLLNRGGLLATFSCSHHISRDAFLEVIRQGLHDAKRLGWITQVFSQPLDHPILATIPETEYLKGFLLELD